MKTMLEVTFLGFMGLAAFAATIAVVLLWMAHNGN